MALDRLCLTMFEMGFMLHLHKARALLQSECNDKSGGIKLHTVVAVCI